jgi:hypothetical protein
MIKKEKNHDRLTMASVAQRPYISQSSEKSDKYLTFNAFVW